MDAGLQRAIQRLLAAVLLVHLTSALAYVHSQPRFAGEGRVVAVDEANGMVTLDHGPIEQEYC